MSKKILIVEDQWLIAQEMQIGLERYNYEITAIVSNGDDAIVSVSENTPDIILMDLNLNGSKSGVDTALEIARFHSIPVIFITGFSDDESVENSKIAKPYGYIIKPVKYDELKIAIEIALYKHQADIKIINIENEKRMQERISLRNQRLASLGELSASIAHEIRQPLQVIKTLSESILFDYQEIKETNGKGFVDIERIEKISSNVDKINNMIIQLSDLIKKENRDNKKELDVNSMIHKILSFYTHQFEHNNISIQLEFEENLPHIQYSEIQFEQIMNNIIKNSIDAFSEVAKDNKKIIIKTTRKHSHVLFEFIDTATGVVSDIEEKIFNPLFTTKKDSDSDAMGLGLYIVNSIIQSNKGFVDYENNEYGGLTFKILFIGYN
ncbi:MAG: hypothetical protein A2015_04745 [Spirochaetes bacterium GWF1_31_7]|nr:MAG: hypothetical protein A2Y30_05125 [Spirochaetes bacterium GWE1_32_154]OHD48777.1 MAG: hypothetical protein A2Y29_03100 [Spirochaetes bacterium GWE2_31_10]OHD52840.1 MAG: hypothetical protein A2015_04745 [Spirochaetes bacterium GWF1_31_7]OHD74152.1 MAG: hypothetical protein A2355_14045 [Spirochaetes bacterium RIFOXYB1_FULL_32_8]HBD95182.1 hypothetical protein [Spirochaetia bacterium]